MVALRARPMSWLRRFAGDRKGVSAVEFALILPILLSLFFGGYEVTQGMMVNRKVTHVSSALGDLVGQAKTITNNDMKNILDASASIMAPYATDILKIVVTQVKIDSNGKATVDWSDARNATALPKGSTVSLPSAIKTPNTYLIMSEVEYLYTPPFGYVITGDINFDERAYLKPRRSNSVARTS